MSNELQSMNLEYRTSSVEVRRPMRRRGFTLTEVMAAGVVLMVAMTVTVQVLGFVAIERRGAERRQWAVQEAANVMERLTAQSWESVTPASVGAINLSPEMSAVLPDGELKVAVADALADAGVKQITVELRWENRSGVRETPVRLTAWIYRRGGVER